MEYTIDDEINQIDVFSPHLVILGAGASRASFPNGDANGKKLPLMDDFIKTLNLEHDLTYYSRGIKNFEEIFSAVYDAKDYDLVQKLELSIYDYFKTMEIEDTPNTYDYLLLSLRKKDYIATFNWDPLLLHAYYRNSKKKIELPQLLFLHGNVGVGFCKKCNTSGVNGRKCSSCKEKFSPTSLLYPIKKKDYQSTQFIKNQWDELHSVLKCAYMLTIFGYGAPQSDVEAIELLKKGWGTSESRQLEEIEIIDLRSEEELVNSWQKFIHSHHYQIHDNFQESWIARHPRRTGEAHFNQNLDAKFIPDNPIPSNLKLEEIWEWLIPLTEAEKK